MLVAFSRSHGFICRKVVGDQPVKLANDLGCIARSEVEDELESFGLVYASRAVGSHLTVAPRWKRLNSPADFLVW